MGGAWIWAEQCMLPDACSARRYYRWADVDSNPFHHHEWNQRCNQRHRRPTFALFPPNNGNPYYLPQSLPGGFLPYNHGHGAGMSVAQLTHGLLTLPHLLLRVKLHYEPSHATTMTTIRTNPGPRPTTSRCAFSNKNNRRSSCFFCRNAPHCHASDASTIVLLFTGASTMDCATCSYLHWKGWESWIGS